ncbi:MAG: hypothetical protein HYU86_12270 [Chloroflexi bacterium]|nr:hypothetical protein [Chloroflexota bacterium]
MTARGKTEEKRDIVVVYGKSLLAQGIERLLRKVEDIEVVGIDLERAGAMESIRSVQPGTVVLDMDDVSLKGGDLILRLLQNVSSLTVVCLTNNGERADIYHKEQKPLTTTQELWEIIGIMGKEV